MPKRCDILPERWDEAADLYELGFKHASAIARDLGVSPQTVMREMKRRGAIKGRRAHETVAELEAFLDNQARQRAHVAAMAESWAASRRAATCNMLDHMMSALLDADACGDLTLAEAEIERTAAAFGARIAVPSRRRSIAT